MCNELASEEQLKIICFSVYRLHYFIKSKIYQNMSFESLCFVYTTILQGIISILFQMNTRITRQKCQVSAVSKVLKSGDAVVIVGKLKIWMQLRQSVTSEISKYESGKRKDFGRFDKYNSLQKKLKQNSLLIKMC